MKGRNLLHFHRIESPECSYINGKCDLNVPFHTREQIAQKRSALDFNTPNDAFPQKQKVRAKTLPIINGSGGEVVPDNQAEDMDHMEDKIQSLQNRVQLLEETHNQTHRAFIQKLDQVQQMAFTPEQKAALMKEIQNQQMALNSIGFAINPQPSTAMFTSPSSQSQQQQIPPPATLPRPPSQPPRVGSSVPPPPTGPSIPLEMMKFEEARLNTYVRWASHPDIDISELARAGFYYTGSSDCVQCAFCENVLRNWEPGDIPTFEHRQHFPRCRLVMGLDVGNVPIAPDRRKAVEDNFNLAHASQAADNRRRLELQKHQNEQNRQQQVPPWLPQNNTSNERDTGMSAMGINMDIPKHPEYATIEARLTTFKEPNWVNSQPIQDLANAGFYYTKEGDNVRCFHCDGGLHYGKKEDNPFYEHARWFPRCMYIRQIKGAWFVDDIAQQSAAKTASTKCNTWTRTRTATTTTTSATTTAATFTFKHSNYFS